MTQNKSAEWSVCWLNFINNKVFQQFSPFNGLRSQRAVNIQHQITF